MKLFKLTSTQQPGDTIQNFETLAWVERYKEAGDFQLVVKNEVSILTALPLGVLISHTDTKEVMIVENHEINRDAEKNLLITVSGRSFETFAENRITGAYDLSIVNPAGGATYIQFLSSRTSAAAASTLLKAGLEPGTALAADAITNLLVQTDIRVFDTAMEHVVKRGDVYSRVLEFLDLAGAGLKTIRPNGAQTTMNLVISDGLDLRTSLIFYAQYEDLDDAKYFWSIKGYKNYTMIAAHIHARTYRHRDVLVDVTGLDRRVLYTAADDLEGTYSPPTATDVVASRAQSALDENKKVSLIQAQISKTAKPKFKIDYDVGDLVTVFGEFGTAQSMRVTEHILTVDKDGMRGFPSLTIL